MTPVAVNSGVLSLFFRSGCEKIWIQRRPFYICILVLDVNSSVSDRCPLQFDVAVSFEVKF